MFNWIALLLKINADFLQVKSFTHANPSTDISWMAVQTVDESKMQHLSRGDGSVHHWGVAPLRCPAAETDTGFHFTNFWKNSKLIGWNFVQMRSKPLAFVFLIWWWIEMLILPNSRKSWRDFQSKQFLLCGNNKSNLPANVVLCNKRYTHFFIQYLHKQDIRSTFYV